MKNSDTGRQSRRFADADILSVAAKIREADRRLVQNPHKAGRPAAMLDVGPARLADGGHVERIAGRDEAGLDLREPVVGLPPAHSPRERRHVRLPISSWTFLTVGVKAISAKACGMVSSCRSARPLQTEVRQAWMIRRACAHAASRSFRSASRIGWSLMLAKRRRMSPRSSNSQFSLP